MLVRRPIAALAAAIAIILQPAAMLHAQGPTPEDVQRLSALVDIRQSVIGAVGASAETVDVSATGKVLTVARINSNMNHSTHAGRDNEAQAIARIVSDRISGRPEFSSLVSIRINYEMRSTLFRRTHILVIDSVEFRTDPSGRFQFHQT